MTISRLEKLLKSATNSPLGQLVQGARDRQDLVSLLCAKLDPDLARQIVAANLRDDGELVLICRSSAWASRLRFESDSLLQAMRDGGLPATQLKVRVTSGDNG